MQDAELLLLLRQEGEKRPDLAKTLNLYVALVAARAEVSAPVPPDWSERARLRLESGEPALDIEELPVNWEAVTHLARQVCQIAARHEPEVAEAFARIQSRLGGDVVPDVDPDLIGFVMNQALHPFLRAYADAAAPFSEERRWHRGDCPVCGGRPDFAALTAEVGDRRLLCARCDTEWTYRRVGCPFCGNEDPGSLGYFPAGDGAYRLYVCERCKGYLKTVDLRETWHRRPLAVERILTVGLDLAASLKGYRTAPS